MPKDHNFLISGKKCLWRYTKLRGKAEGWTYHDQKILIEERLKGRKRCEVEIHEFLHFANPNLSEEAVTLQAKDLSKILWALGYRMQSTESNRNETKKDAT